MDGIQIHPNLVIPLEDLKISYSRSSGPGGQNVNKLNTRVCVCLNILSCDTFSDDQKQTLMRLLRTRIDKQGNIRIFCQEHRSQIANRNAAMQRLGDMIRIALKPRRKRKKTKIPRRAIEKRLREKKKRSELKQSRSGGWESG